MQIYKDEINRELARRQVGYGAEQDADRKGQGGYPVRR